MNLLERIKKAISLILVILVISLSFDFVKADQMPELSVSLSTNRPVAASNHAIQFTTGTTGLISQIEIQYGKTLIDRTKPQNLNLASTSLGNMTGLTSTLWTFDNSFKDNGLLKISSVEGEIKNEFDQISINLDNILNPAVGDCTTSGQTYDQCYIYVTTYSDTGTTIVDNGSTAYTINAGNITNSANILGNTRPRTMTSHAISFNIDTAYNIKMIEFQYVKSASQRTKPAFLDLFSTTLDSVSGLTSNQWVMNKDSVGSGFLRLVSEQGENKSTNDNVTVSMGSIQNPEIGDCTLSDSMDDVCYMYIRTFADTAGQILVDYGMASYTIKDLPSLSLVVEGVATGTQTNGIITTVSSNYNFINFGNLKIREPKYAAQKLKVQTTAANGYRVTMRLDGVMQGIYPANKIDPFDRADVTWNNPLPWTHPNGTEDSFNTGWLGANTSDERVDQCLGLTNVWSGGYGASKFGPVSSTRHLVMCSNGKDYGTEEYITYAIEVNEVQIPDLYSGTLVYNITATY